MDFINKKRKIGYENSEKSNIIKDNISESYNPTDNLIINNENKDSMKELVDECFDNFIKGNTNKLIENYNLLKQKFFESV